MKITYSKENINSFGGINFADNIIGRTSMYRIIDQNLGGRGLRAEHWYSNLIRAYFLIVLCGGKCSEDITEHLRDELNHVNGFNVCSADTLLRM